MIKLVISIITLILASCSDNSLSKNGEQQKKETDSIFPTNRGKVISDPTNTLEKQIQTIELQYTLWGCACANWIKPSDAIRYGDSGFAEHHIFIEPADTSLYFPDSSFDINKENISVTGQFYIKEDYPKGTIQMEESLDKAKVFRYTKIKRVKKTD